MDKFPLTTALLKDFAHWDAVAIVPERLRAFANHSEDYAYLCLEDDAREHELGIPSIWM